jgi:hypothetical protein
MRRRHEMWWSGLGLSLAAPQDARGGQGDRVAEALGQAEIAWAQRVAVVTSQHGLGKLEFEVEEQGLGRS